MSRKIAPRLADAMRNWGGGLDPDQYDERDGQAMEREFRALTAVVRAAVAASYGMWRESDDAPWRLSTDATPHIDKLRAALSRLSRLSGGQR